MGIRSRDAVIVIAMVQSERACSGCDWFRRHGRSITPVDFDRVTVFGTQIGERTGQIHSLTFADAFGELHFVKRDFRWRILHNDLKGIGPQASGWSAVVQNAHRDRVRTRLFINMIQQHRPIVAAIVQRLFAAAVAIVHEHFERIGVLVAKTDGATQRVARK